MKTRYIYIGYPKTGSSTLQTGFFEAHPQLACLNLEYPEVRDAIGIDVVLKDSITYESSKVNDVVKRHLDMADANSQYRAVGVATENLSLWYDGGHADPRLVAERLREAFGDAKIMITVRNQFGLIRSLYAQFVRSGGYLSFDQYLEANYWGFYSYLFPQILFYKTFKRYENLFGVGRVKVTLFENLIGDPQGAVDAMCRFLEISPIELTLPHLNQSPSRVSMAALRLINRLYKYNLGRSYYMPLTPNSLATNWDKEIGFVPKRLRRHDRWRRYLIVKTQRLDARFGFKPAKPAYSEFWKEKITDLYAEDNRSLMEETELDLREHGYPVAS